MEEAYWTLLILIDDEENEFEEYLLCWWINLVIWGEVEEMGFDLGLSFDVALGPRNQGIIVVSKDDYTLINPIHLQS